MILCVFFFNDAVLFFIHVLSRLPATHSFAQRPEGARKREFKNEPVATSWEGTEEGVTHTDALAARGGYPIHTCYTCKPFGSKGAHVP